MARLRLLALATTLSFFPVAVGQTREYCLTGDLEGYREEVKAPYAPRQVKVSRLTLRTGSHLSVDSKSQIVKAVKVTTYPADTEWPSVFNEYLRDALQQQRFLKARVIE